MHLFTRNVPSVLRLESIKPKTPAAPVSSKHFKNSISTLSELALANFCRVGGQLYRETSHHVHLPMLVENNMFPTPDNDCSLLSQDDVMDNIVQGKKL